MQEKKTYPSHLTLRLSAKQWEQLECDAAGLSYSEYAKSILFGKSYSIYKLLAKILGLLGMRRIADNHNYLAQAIKKGILFVTPELEAVILEASADTREMKTHLMNALEKMRNVQ